MNNKIKLIDTGKCNILTVMVPEYASNFRFDKGHLWYDDKNFQGCCIYITGKSEKWQILGLSTELTEEQCKPLFKHKDGYGLSFELPKPNNRAGYFTALAAMKALLEANQCFSVNPYGEKPVNEDFYWGYLSDLEQWQQAQENTGPRLILNNISKV